MTVTFKKPYGFEGKEYTSLDLSKLEALTASQLSNASKAFAAQGLNKEMISASVSYNCMIAAEVCGLPDVFFSGLPAKEAMKVSKVVENFFLEED